MTLEPCFEFFDDFFYFNSEKWLARQASGVGATATIINAEDEIRGGVLALAVSDTNNHKFGIKLGGGEGGGSWKITKDSGKQLWYATKIRLLQAEDVAMYVGLFNPEKITTVGKHMGLDDTGAPEFAAAPDGWTDGIYMRILTATPDEIDFAVAKNMTETEVQANIVANDMAWHELGFHFDGVNTITPIIDRLAYPAHAVAADAANFPDDLGLLPRFYIQTGEAAIKVLKADWIRVRQER